jgi:hypothetical protein
MSDTNTPIGDLIDVSKMSSQEISALEEYSQSVNLLADKELNLEFNNKDQHHAAFVMAAIFRTSKQSIKIFTGSFSGEISNNPVYLKYLSDAIVSSNLKVEVIFENRPNESSKCLKLLKDLRANGKDVSIFSLPTDYKTKVLDKQFGGRLGHFTVGDDRMFRYETDKDKFAAYCNFDDKAIVTTLNRNFDIFKLNSVAIG